MVDILKDPVNKVLMRLTLPMIFGLLSIIIFNLVDTFFVSRLGTDALAAFSFTFPVVTFLGSLAMGFSIAATAVVSRAIGAKNQAKVKRLTTDAVFLAVILVGLLTVVGYFTIEPLFRFLGAEGEILQHIKSYMQIWYGGMIFLVVPMVSNGCIRATGDAVTPAIIMTISALTNLILDPIFIFGWGAIPPLGIEGAAIATVIARATTLLSSAFVLLVRLKMFTWVIPNFREGLASWRLLLTIAVPAAFSNMVNPLTLGFITALIAKFGHEAVAAFGIVSRIQMLSLLIMMALAAANTPFAGQNLGARKPERVLLAMRNSYLLCIGWGVLVGVGFAFFNVSLIKLFTGSPEIVLLGSTYLAFVPFSYGFEGTKMILGSVCNAIQRPLIPTGVIIIKMLLVYLPMAYLLAKFYGVRGVFVAEMLANVAAGAMAFYWWRKLVRLLSVPLTGLKGTPDY